MNIHKILDIAINTDIAIFLWSPPGIGKTTNVLEYCKKKGIFCKILNLHAEDPLGFTGLVYNDESKNTRYGIPYWAQQILEENKKGKLAVLFLDEMNRAKDETLISNCLALFTEKRVKDVVMPNLRIIVACNYADDTVPLPEAIIERGAHFYFTGHDTYELSKPTFSPIVVSFLNENMSMLCSPSDKPELPIKYNNRKWTWISRIIEKYDINDPDVRYFITALLPAEVASAFFQHIDQHVLHINDILKNTPKYKKILKDEDYATINTTIAAYFHILSDDEIMKLVAIATKDNYPGETLLRLIKLIEIHKNHLRKQVIEAMGSAIDKIFTKVK